MLPTWSVTAGSWNRTRPATLATLKARRETVVEPLVSRSEGHIFKITGLWSLGRTGMAAPDTLRYAKIPLTNGSGAIPALGFGMLIPDPLTTKQAVKTALEVGFR